LTSHGEVAGSIPASPTQKKRLLADRSNRIGRNPDVAAVFAAALEVLDGTLHLEVFDADVELGTIPDTYGLSTGKGAERWRHRTS
jgi:hypothetical protein